MAALRGLAPVLLVTDVRVAGEYYRDRLGFDVSFYDRIPDHYAYVERDGCHIHFARFEGAPPWPNVEVVPPDMFDVYFWVEETADGRQLVGRFNDNGRRGMIEQRLLGDHPPTFEARLVGVGGKPFRVTATRIGP
jgi:catechol 2,3-dioxygenase-like lactoylglutathione lyase family enzyme